MWTLIGMVDIKLMFVLRFVNGSNGRLTSYVHYGYQLVGLDTYLYIFPIRY